MLLHFFEESAILPHGSADRIQIVIFNGSIGTEFFSGEVLQEEPCGFFRIGVRVHGHGPRPVIGAYRIAGLFRR